MRIANGEWRGADITITGPSDVLQCPKSMYLCSLQFAWKKTLLLHCTVNMPLTALSVTRLEDAMGNSQNRGLHLIDPRKPDERGQKWMAEMGVEPGPINPDDWAIFTNITLDFCHLPVFTFAAGTEITYSAPNIDTRQFTVEEWRKLEDSFGSEYVAKLVQENRAKQFSTPPCPNKSFFLTVNNCNAVLMSHGNQYVIQVIDRVLFGQVRISHTFY